MNYKLETEKLHLSELYEQNFEERAELFSVNQNLRLWVLLTKCGPKLFLFTKCGPYNVSVVPAYFVGIIIIT